MEGSLFFEYWEKKLFPLQSEIDFVNATGNGVNSDYIMLLVKKRDRLNIETIPIEVCFDEKITLLKELCHTKDDNLDLIIGFFDALQIHLPQKTFKYSYCLSNAYKNVEFSINDLTTFILKWKSLQYQKDRDFKNRKEDAEQKYLITNFDLEKSIFDFKQKILINSFLWFKAFDIDIAYKKAKENPNLIYFSHRLSGRSNDVSSWEGKEYSITEDFKFVLKTNFSYGNSSFFYLTLIYKDIPIVPFSDWVDYRYCGASEVIRYTKDFKKTVVREKRGIEYLIEDIDNSNWETALEYIRDATNLLLEDESSFVEKYILAECKKMVKGLGNFYKNSDFEFKENVEIFDEKEDRYSQKEDRYRRNFNGVKLIDFRAEKIIGALSFIDKLLTLDRFISTEQFIYDILLANRGIISFVIETLEDEKNKLEKSKLGYETFLEADIELDIVSEDVQKFLEFKTKYKVAFTNICDVVERSLFYKEKKKEEYSEYIKNYCEEHKSFDKLIFCDIILQDSEKHIHSIRLHSDNIKKLEGYIDEYNTYIDKFSDVKRLKMKVQTAHFVGANNSYVMRHFADENSVIRDRDFGNGFSWSFENGVLTICGNGYLDSYCDLEVGEDNIPFSSVVNDVVSVILSEGITGFETDIFHSCGNLRSVSIPASVVEINKPPTFSVYFGYNKRLEAIYVDRDNSFFSSENGVLFNTDRTSLLKYPCGKKDREYVIPDSVNSLEEKSFMDSRYLVILRIKKEIDLPHYPFYQPFYRCENLETVDAPFMDISFTERFVQHNDCYSGIFAECDKLKIITNREGLCVLEVIDDVVFEYYPLSGKKILLKYPNSNTNGSYTIPNGVTEIYGGAFDGCEILTCLTIPASMEFIDEWAFVGCININKVFINKEIPPSIKSKYDICLYNFHESCTLYVPNGSVDKYKTNKIWKNSFKYINGILSSDEDCLLF